MIHGVGIDIVHNAQIKKSIEKYGARYLDKVFTPEEQAYCGARPDPVTHYAARFAAKESFIKACGPMLTREGQVFRNIEIALDDRGCPHVLLNGETARQIPFNEYRAHLSLTHDKMVSAAVTVIEKVQHGSA
jgi:holo-[acyl-carrier protein] synthase